MTYTKSTNNKPRKFIFRRKETDIKLLVHGQGVFIFTNENTNDNCSFFIYDEKQENGLKVEFTKSIVNVNRINNNELLIDDNNKYGMSTKKGAFYWFSVDSQNLNISAGVGEPRKETSIYQFQFPISKENKVFLESLVLIKIPPTSISINPLKLLRDPITENVPLLVKNTHDLTMNDVAKGIFIPKSNLNSISQKLYDCISGRQFVLNDGDFPEFSKAIEYSIATPGKWCHTRLIQKSKEFSKEPNIKETYLRITLGKNNGESPGVPYVMEIWPVGHYSPIHNHAGANAIIRVLHGKINVSLFPFLCENKESVPPFGVADFKKDDITWISPELNQVHQLKNLETNTKTCITIQCYMYNLEDDKHSDYFDFADGDGTIGHYEPDSDMEFIQFKAKMKEEWENRSWFTNFPKCSW